MHFLRAIARRCRFRNVNVHYSATQAIPTTAYKFTNCHFSEKSVTSTEASPSHFTDVPGASAPGTKLTMLYTCKVCDTRAAKTISKRAYYHGVVLIRCPTCENLHLIADRLKWFGEESTDIERILQEKGEKVKFVTDDNVFELTGRDICG